MYSHIILVTGSRSWVSEDLVRKAFNAVWRDWGGESVTRPLLVSGHCRDGADAIAERVWAAAGFEIKPFEVSPEAWKRHGGFAGLLRNQEMVDFVVSQRGHAETAETVCIGFAAPCRLATCRKTPAMHVTHGTGDCMTKAQHAGIEIREVNDPHLAPFRPAK